MAIELAASECLQRPRLMRCQRVETLRHLGDLEIPLWNRCENARDFSQCGLAFRLQIRAPRVKQDVLRELDDHVQVDVMDDGVGLPKENRSRLTEPYVTTREKGTGLGLAIVKRIMEEHGGRVTLGDAPDDFFGGKGALVRLIFPRDSGGSVAQAAEQVETVGA